MRRLVSSSTLLVALVSCLFILPACDSGGGGGGGGGDGTVTATSENSFDFSFTDSGGSSNSAKSPETYTGFAFELSTELEDGTEYYAVYFSSAQTFNADEPTNAAIAGFILVQGTQNPSGTISLGGSSSPTAFAFIAKGFDKGEGVGKRTAQFLNSGDIEFTNNNGNVVITDFKGVTAFETVIDVSTDPNSLVSQSSVDVTLNGQIDPAEGVPKFVEGGEIEISYETSN